MVIVQIAFVRLLLMAVAIAFGVHDHKPMTAAEFYKRGRAHAEKAQYDKAIADCSEAIRLSPNWTAAVALRAYAFHRNGMCEEAISDYKASVLANISE